MKNTNTKQRLFEIMSRVDKTFKSQLNEDVNAGEPSTPQENAFKRKYGDNWREKKAEHDSKVTRTSDLDSFLPITTPLGSADDKLFISVVNKGIDSHLEGFTKSNFSVRDGRRIYNFAISEIPILLRRLEEIGTDEALQWKSDIENHKEEVNETPESNTDDMVEFVIPDWALSTLINGDNSGNSDEDDQKINAFVERIVNQYGNANFIMGDYDENDLGFRHSNNIDNLGANCEKLFIKPSK